MKSLFITKMWMNATIIAVAVPVVVRTPSVATHVVVLMTLPWLLMAETV